MPQIRCPYSSRYIIQSESATWTPHRLISLGLWGSSGREEHRAFDFNSQISMHLFSRRYQGSLKCREDWWQQVEKFAADYIEVSQTGGLKTEQDFGAVAHLSDKSERMEDEVYAWLNYSRLAISRGSPEVLKTLSKFLIATKIVQECRNGLNSMFRFVSRSNCSGLLFIVT